MLECKGGGAVADLVLCQGYETMKISSMKPVTCDKKVCQSRRRLGYRSTPVMSPAGSLLTQGLHVSEIVIAQKTVKQFNIRDWSERNSNCERQKIGINMRVTKIFLFTQLVTENGCVSRQWRARILRHLSHARVTTAGSGHLIVSGKTIDKISMSVGHQFRSLYQKYQC